MISVEKQTFPTIKKDVFRVLKKGIEKYNIKIMLMFFVKGVFDT